MAAGLALLTVALYSSVRHYPFIDYDDPSYVVENAHVRSGLSWMTFKWLLTATEQANWHPVTWISHALDWQLFGLNAGRHHLSSVLFHALNTALLFVVLMRVTGARGRSLLVAALFAIHPSNVESVAWVAERKTVLCTFFFLLALAAYGWYARRPTPARYIVLVGLFVLGLASKPLVITLPLVLLLCDFWPLRRILGWSVPSGHFSVPQAALGKVWLEKVPLFALCTGSAAITLIAQRSAGAVPSVLELPLATRFENAIHSYVAYLWKALWPTGLAPFYPGSPAVAWQVALAMTFLAAVSVLAWRVRRKWPYVLGGWLFFLGTLVPVIGIIQAGGQAMADRHMYIPMIGAFVMAVWGLSDLANVAGLDLRLRALAAAAILTLFACVTLRQLSYWRSSYDLWSHTLQVTSHNLVAEDNLGVELLKQGRTDEALPHFQNAARINPRDPLSHANIGADYQDHGQLAQAMGEYATVIQYTSDPTLLVIAYENLGVIYHRLGDSPKALATFQQVLQINPQETQALMAIAALRNEQNVRKTSLNAETEEDKMQPPGPGNRTAQSRVNGKAQR